MLTRRSSSIADMGDDDGYAVYSQDDALASSGIQLFLSGSKRIYSADDQEDEEAQPAISTSNQNNDNNGPRLRRTRKMLAVTESEDENEPQRFRMAAYSDDDDCEEESAHSYPNNNNNNNGRQQPLSPRSMQRVVSENIILKEEVRRLKKKVRSLETEIRYFEKEKKKRLKLVLKAEKRKRRHDDRYLSGWHIYSQDHYQAEASKLGTANATVVLKRLGTLWAELGPADKKVYNEKAETRRSEARERKKNRSMRGSTTTTTTTAP